jgi:lysophospholipid acyltransferase (LPLAT)-like uncharacterized protein
MKLNHPLITRLLGRTAAYTVRAWMRTLDYRCMYANPAIDPVHSVSQPRIYVFWHENILCPLYLRANCHIAMLLSQHRDADVLESMARLSGFATVRGSTYRGGAKAILELAERSKSLHLAMTPDGPRGPRRTLAQGPIYLAARLGLPIVALGIGYNHPFRTRSWDRFAIPRPYSRCRAVTSDEIWIPTDLGRDGLEEHRLTVERKLNELTDEATRWAETGAALPNEVIARRQSADPPQKISPRLPRRRVA